MKDLQIQKTNQTPEIDLNAETGIFKFSGRSLPEDSTIFYNRILEWLNEYMDNLGESIEVFFELDYFNTSSAKAIFAIFVKFDELYKSDFPVKINWVHEEDDEDMKELGEEYQDLFSVPIKLVAKINE